MNMKLSSLDVVKAAIILEEKGERFYREAARKLEGEAQTLLLKLAEMEKIHAARFNEIAQEIRANGETLSEEEKVQELAFLDALTDDRIIEKSMRIEEQDSLEAVFHIAMQLEKNSVFFYSALKENLLINMDQTAIDALISEEIKHFRMLNQALLKFKDAGRL